jgi:hypothetical protein
MTAAAWRRRWMDDTLQRRLFSEAFWMRELGHFFCIIIAGSYYTESEVQICWIDWCVPDGTTARYGGVPRFQM